MALSTVVNNQIGYIFFGRVSVEYEQFNFLLYITMNLNKSLSIYWQTKVKFLIAIREHQKVGNITVTKVPFLKRNKISKYDKFTSRHSKTRLVEPLFEKKYRI